MAERCSALHNTSLKQASGYQQSMGRRQSDIGTTADRLGTRLALEAGARIGAHGRQTQ